MVKDDIEMLTQPLMTEEGFLNEACMNELAAVIENMPPSYIRLANKPEWTTPIFISYREIVGYFANWAVRNIQGDDPTFPPGLEKMVGLLTAIIRPKFTIAREWANLTLCEINKMLHDALWEEPIFNSWNDSKVVAGWLDLHALLHQVCISIRNEKRESDRFSEEFDRRWANDGLTKGNHEQHN